MISVITCTIRDHMMEQVFQNYAGQKLKHKELIIVLNKDNMDVRKWKKKAAQYPGVKLLQLPEKATVGECKNTAIDHAAYPLLAKMDDDDYYSPYYLPDMWRAYRKKKPDIIGKSSVYYYFAASGKLRLFDTGNENRWTEWTADSTLVFTKDVWKRIPFREKDAGTDQVFQQEARKKGIRLFSTDRWNHVIIRSSNPRDHTWQVADHDLFRVTRRVRCHTGWKSCVTRRR
ncbi:glycosyltransferase [Salibacterium sp. K-3]